MPEPPPHPLGDTWTGQRPPGGNSLTLHTDLLGDLQVPGAAGRGAELEALAARAAIYATRARGDGTRRAYRSAWRGYEAWCRSLGREPLSGDPDLLAMYATKRADDGVAVSTLRVDLAAIRTAHQLASIPLDLRNPRLAMVIEGITRGRGTRPLRQATPAVPEILRQLLSACPLPGTAIGARDRAMLLLGFGAALRRSELVALRLGDVTAVPGRGLRLLVRRSKTDQHGQGQDIAIWANPSDPLFCPLAALDTWLAQRHLATDLDWSVGDSARQDRPLFCAVTKAGQPTGIGLSDKAVVRLIKGAAARAGLDPERYSGHSLRAGLATAAGNAGASLPDLMRQTRHKSTQVALAYLRPADLWRNNVTKRMFTAPDTDES
ncbi:tyrosine-type recombinase/integrase [Acidisphaera sp. L21]|uniref:tyrosine-type recombinase/integrase n=1 Tax=Acidisphaera sp. L21 TaxID=1641851 RepID=UPI00131BF707|nr:tyrosine-type recombinase/integrase [Acidisphaera sp. L21]